MKRSGVLIGLVVVFLGMTWLLQGAEVLDGRFFTNRGLSIAMGIGTTLSGVALMAWAFRRVR